MDGLIPRGWLGMMSPCTVYHLPNHMPCPQLSVWVWCACGGLYSLVIFSVGALINVDVDSLDCMLIAL